MARALRPTPAASVLTNTIHDAHDGGDPRPDDNSPFTAVPRAFTGWLLGRPEPDGNDAATGRRFYHPADPGVPLNGPWIREVIQPP